MAGIKRKKILITGASGYIGRNLQEYLQLKYEIIAPTHQQLDLTNSDSVNTFFNSRKFNLIIHCAVVGGSRKEEHINNAFFVNTKMFYNLVQKNNSYDKLIYLGSGAEYDKAYPIVQISENEFGKRIPSDEYGFFKYICSKYIEKSDFIINLRIFGLFGKYEDYRYRFISNTICRNILNLPIHINENVYFDYVFIDDFVRIVEHFIEHDVKHKFYNIGTGYKIDLLTIANKINSISNNKCKIVLKNIALKNEYTCSNIRLMTELHNFKFSDFDFCLKKLYDWYLNNKNLINKNEL